MKINLKKGFIRLWILLSILWIVISLFLFAPKSEEIFGNPLNQESFDKAYDLTYKLNLSELSSDKKEILSEAIRRKLLPEIIFMIPLKEGETPNGSKITYNPIPTKELLDNSPLRVTFLNETKLFPAGTKVEEIWDTFLVIIEQNHIQKRNRVMLNLAGIVAIPPLTLLLFGLSLAWVIKGFKNVTEPGA